MRLLRHFLAVSMVVGVVIALGFAWSTSSAASIVADDRGGRRLVTVQSSASSFSSRQFDQRGAGGISLSNVSDLVQTLVILSLITAAVVVFDRTRRRRRNQRFPMRPSRTST